MYFQTKLMLTALMILIITLALNSFLGLASFEKIYTSSLISVYEMAGKNLKRKLEQPLRYGKELKNFSGMDRYLDDLIHNVPEISEVKILSPSGDVWHSAVNPELDSQTDSLHHADKEQTQVQLTEVPYSSGGKISRTFFAGNSYQIFITINRQDQLLGFINLSFSRQVVYKRLKQMAIENLRALGPLILITSVLLLILMGFFVMRPLRRRIRKIENLLSDEPGGRPETLLPLAADATDTVKKTDDLAGIESCLGVFKQNYLRIREKNEGLAELHRYLISDYETLAKATDELADAVATVDVNPEAKMQLERVITQNKALCKDLEAALLPEKNNEEFV